MGSGTGAAQMLMPMLTALMLIIPQVMLGICAASSVMPCRHAHAREYSGWFIQTSLCRHLLDTFLQRSAWQFSCQLYVSGVNAWLQAARICSGDCLLSIAHPAW